MSLRIWLPLNGNLDNKGLDDVVVTNNGATVNDNGKVGKCYSFSTDNSYITVDSTPLKKYMEFSFACWVKIISWNTNYATIFAIKNSTSVSWNNLIFSLLRNGSNSNLCFNISNGSSYTSTSCQTGTLSTDTWYHIVCIYKSNEIKLYQNGNLVSTYSTTVTPNFNSIDNFWIGKSNAVSYQSNIFLNDVRIYDHALSLKEIKEISKGLVLHYPLADKYIENTTNLITTEDCLSTTCYNGAISKYSYGTNTDMYKEVTTFQGKKGTKVYNQTNGTGMYPYVYISNMYTSDGTNSPAYKTLSFDYYTTISTSICPYKLGSGNGTATYIVTNNETQTGTGTNQVVIPVKPNMWNHIEVTFHGTTEADAQWGYIQNQPSHTSDTSNFWFFANMQLETKDHATGYAGIGGTRNSNMIYDCSGYDNNGTISGVLTISDDTPKYSVSTYMPKSALIIHPRPVFGGTDQEWTCAMWVKLDNVTQGQQAMNNFNMSNNIVHTTTSLLYLNGGTNDYYMYGSQAVSAGIWTHVAFVFKNSDGTRNVYINGVLKNGYGPNKTSIPKGIPDIVTVGTNLAGYISDYRVYATALSADQILELYKTPASIDKNNNFYAYSYKELNQGNEIEYLYDLTKSGNGTFSQDENGLYLDQDIWVTHNYIPINSTNKTYKYDIIYSCDTGNQFYIGWERYDANKTSRSNNACVYVVATKPSEDRIKYRVRGIVDLLNDGVNPCAFIKLRILNKWTGSDSDTNGTATIHYLSLKEYTDTTTQDMTPLNINKQGIVNTTEILEKDIGVSVSNVYELNSHNFYEY